MHTIKNTSKLLFVGLALIISVVARAQEVFELKPTNKLINDYAQVLSEQQIQTLEYKLRAYYDSTSNQIAVVVVNTLNGYEVVDYATRIGIKWGVGIKGKNNGALVLVAVKDRKAAIVTGYGLEGAITDAATRQIRENYMNPNFRNGDYYKGIDEATTVMIQMASGEFKNDQRTAKKDGAPIGFIIFFLMIFIIIPFISSYRNTKKNHFGKKNLDFWTVLMLMNMVSGSGRGRSSGGFGGGGFSGGGSSFGGFGGGSFGGGGSGGSW